MIWNKYRFMNIHEFELVYSFLIAIRIKLQMTRVEFDLVASFTSVYGKLPLLVTVKLIFYAIFIIFTNVFDSSNKLNSFDSSIVGR